MTAAVGARPLTAAERADEARRMANAQLLGAVRWRQCPVCGIGAYSPCQVRPAADHLGRWLAAWDAGKIARGALAEVVGGLVVITAAELVEERAL